MAERRVNLVRLAALLVFYGHHLLNVLIFRDDALSLGRYHTAATAVALAWSLTVLAIHLSLSLARLGRWLSLAAVCADLLLITLLLCLSRDPKSAMSGLYYLVIISAGVRLSLPLVCAGTLGALAGYGLYQGYCHLWIEPGAAGISRAAQVVFLLSLGAAGLLAGQMVRQARRLARGDARRFCPHCNEPLPTPGEPEADMGSELHEPADREQRRDNRVVGLGLVLLGVLLGIALFLPASNVKLEFDALVGLGFGLVLLVVTGTGLQFRRHELALSMGRGGMGEAAFAGILLVLFTAMLVALAIAVSKAFF